jgi:hypothetical protein
MANLDEKDIPQLSSVVLAAGEERLAKDQKKALSLLANSDSNSIHQKYKEALNIIHHGLQREKDTLVSIGTYLKLSDAKTNQLKNLMENKDKAAMSSIKIYYAYLCREIGQNPAKPSLTAEEQRLHKFIPKRIVGLEYLTDFTYLEKALKDDDIKQKLTIFRLGRLVPWEALNYANGKRSLLEIHNALSAEFSPTEISLQAVKEYMDVLEKAGVIQIEKRRL